MTNYHNEFFSSTRWTMKIKLFVFCKLLFVSLFFMTAFSDRFRLWVFVLTSKFEYFFLLSSVCANLLSFQFGVFVFHSCKGIFTCIVFIKTARFTLLIPCKIKVTRKVHTCWYPYKDFNLSNIACSCVIEWIFVMTNISIKFIYVFISDKNQQWLTVWHHKT